MKQEYSLKNLILYFLRLGTFGFGGPIALTGYMQRDLVEKNGWFSKEDYTQGLALAQLCPGPLATQFAIYLGWIKKGITGATLVAISFIMPSFLMVWLISWCYVTFGHMAWMEGAFYGIGSSIIAIIIRSAVKLIKTTVNKDKLLWPILLINAAITAYTSSEIIWVFLLSGIINMAIRAPIAKSKFSIAPMALFMTGIGGVATTGTLTKIAFYFSWAGAFIFGSGLAIIPFLHGGVVEQFHWLTERQFIDAVAVAMITPGPVIITVAFIGYLVAGFLGACIAALAVFLPCYLFVIILAPYFRRFADNTYIKEFVRGVTAAATGAISGATIVLGRQAITDIPTTIIFMATAAIIFKIKKVPESLVILVTGLIGLLIKSFY